jgi:putative modified peptide
MSDAVLTTEQSRKLIHELATNDSFRERFEEKPAAALVELGIPFHVVVNLNACCLIPRKLGSKEVFHAANQQLNEETAQRFASFMVPSVSMDTPK